jgi:hypothetical protein
MEVKAPKIIVESTKWFDEAKQLVRNYDFHLVQVQMAKPQEKCQFCGTRLVYVALIDGVPFFAETKHPIHKRIGCDCLERVLGDTWKYYNQMQSELKTLKEIVAAEKRKAKYAVDYAKEIEYLSVLPEKLEGEWLRDWSLRFLFDMRKILTTGSKKLSDNQIEYLRKMIARDLIADFRRRLDADDFKIGEWTKRIASLLQMIESVLGPKIHEPNNNDYSFVNSILNYMNFNKKLTPNQMQALNRKFEYYENVIEARKHIGVA